VRRLAVGVARRRHLLFERVTLRIRLLLEIAPLAAMLFAPAVFAQ
jgi:hypothetical protein